MSVSVFLQELGFHMVGLRDCVGPVPHGLGRDWIRVREGLTGLLPSLCVSRGASGRRASAILHLAMRWQCRAITVQWQLQPRGTGEELNGDFTNVWLVDVLQIHSPSFTTERPGLESVALPSKP